MKEGNISLCLLNTQPPPKNSDKGGFCIAHCSKKKRLRKVFVLLYPNRDTYFNEAPLNEIREGYRTKKILSVGLIKQVYLENMKFKPIKESSSLCYEDIFSRPHLKYTNNTH